MWHPHLSKNWVNEKQFEIIDHKRKTYPAFLQVERKEKLFLNEDMFDSKKMQCSCRFVKAEVTRESLVPEKDNSFRTQKLKQNNSIKKKDENLKKSSNIPGISLFQQNSSRFRMKEKVDESQLKLPNYLDLSSLNNVMSNNLSENLLQRKRFKSKEKINKNELNPFNEPNRLLQNKFHSPQSDFSNILPSRGENPLNLNSAELFSNNKNLNNNLNLSQTNVKSILEYLRMNSMMMQNIENLLLGNKNLQNNDLNNISQNLPMNNQMQLPLNNQYLDEIEQLSRPNLGPETEMYLNNNFKNKQYRFNPFQNNNSPYANLLGLQNNIPKFPFNLNAPSLDNISNYPVQMVQNQNNLPQTDSAQDIFKLAQKLLGKNKGMSLQNSLPNLQNINLYG
jgi:hypothetical protein